MEFGKEVLISVNPPDKKDLPDLVEAVGKTLEGLPSKFSTPVARLRSYLSG